MAVRKSGAIHHYSGLSTDTKPTGTTVAPGSTFYEYDTNDTYFTNDSSTWVVKDSKSIKRFAVTTAISAAAAYAANDVIANSATASSATAWAFSSVAAYNGAAGEIVQAQLVSKTANSSVEAKVYLFNGTPGGVKTDNVANTSPVWSDVSTSIYVGRLDFPKSTAQGDAWLPESASCLPLYFTTPVSADDLYAIVTTATAATFSSKELTLALWIRRL